MLPLLGTWPATQACALTGNRTDDPLLHRPALNPHQTGLFLGGGFNAHPRICLLILEREEKEERDRERKKHWCERETSVASCMHPDWRLNLQPRHVSWPGIYLTTFWCMGQHSNQLSHPTRATQQILSPKFMPTLFPKSFLGRVHLFQLSWKPQVMLLPLWTQPHVLLAVAAVCLLILEASDIQANSIS